ncbi:MAG TPA: pyridoxal-phosphate dependent enzyme [Streptosporangiaceae bacterium]|nr:pyridoxal-phosphate dependent enzyme [Streptosporangiaceae bacterium]
MDSWLGWQTPAARSPDGSPEIALPSPLEYLDDDRLRAVGVEVWLKRDDLIHPEVPGNKWRKLKYNLEAAASEGQRTLLTFGGAYSNHIRATAAAGYYFGFSTIGVIRGEEHLPLNPVLVFAVSRGMNLCYLNRTDYRRKAEPSVAEELRRRFGSFYLLPEGGSNELAVRGCTEVVDEIEAGFDVICCPCGTGATLAGVASGLGATQRRALGFSVLKGGGFLEHEVAELQRRTFGRSGSNWRVETRFHFGGYARRTAELDDFIADFSRRHGIGLDWVYTAKMMYGVFALAQEGFFAAGTRIVALMTG